MELYEVLAMMKNEEGGVMDVLTGEQRHKNMSNIRNKDTQAEILLRKALWRKGIRYRKNYQKLPGTPDIVIAKNHIVIFVDGDFWHGRNLEELKMRLDVNRDFWINKLSGNVERDKAVNEQLTEMGWLVLRFWEMDIKHSLDTCVAEILQFVPNH